MRGYAEGFLREFSLNLKMDHDKNKTAGYVSVEFMDNLELVDALCLPGPETVGFGIPLPYDDYFRCDMNKLSTTISKLTGNDMPEITVADKSPEQLQERNGQGYPGCLTRDWRNI